VLHLASKMGKEKMVNEITALKGADGKPIFNVNEKNALGETPVFLVG
jgi:hypothetical protein